MKHFHNNDPIPCANKLQCTGTAAVAEMPENYPTSTNAATEQHADAKSDEDDLSTTKALTRGTQDVNNRNVRHTQDPRMSLEALAQGNSAQCAKMTPVILKSTPHESQDWPQDSLQVTPYACEQEAADSIVTAGHTNGTAKMAKPQIANIDRTPPLGGKLAERACGVNKGNGTECESKSRPQQTKLLCEESHQCSGNANRAIPDAYGLLLEGEWTVCMSGEVSDLERGADMSNGLTEPLMMTIELDNTDGSGVPSMYLGGMCWHAGDTSRPEGQSDGSRGSVDTLNALNRAETEVIGHGEGASTYLGPGDAKCLVLETDSTRNHTDTSNRSTDVPSIETDADISANKTVNIRKRQMSSTPRNSPETQGITMAKPIGQWRKVSAGEGGVYILWNTSIEASGQTFEFGRFESIEEAIAPKVEGEGAVSGDGDRDRDDDGEGGTTSNGHADSSRVEEVLLAGDSQYKCQGRRKLTSAV